MNSYKTSKELKAKATRKLMGNYGTAILLVGITSICSLLSTAILSKAIQITDLTTLILYVCLTIAITVVNGVFNVGSAFFFLNMCCDKEFALSNLFYGFKVQPNKSLTVSLVFTLLQYICLKPMQVFNQLYIKTLSEDYLYQVGSLSSEDYLFLGMLCMVIGLLIYVPISLAISQTFYVMLDFPELSTIETFKRSIQIMKGHKGRLFYLEVSFIPLMLLAIFTCGVGFFWLLPLMQMTMICFYLDLVKTQIEPEEAEAKQL